MRVIIGTNKDSNRHKQITTTSRPPGIGAGKGTKMKHYRIYEETGLLTEDMLYGMLQGKTLTEAVSIDELFFDEDDHVEPWEDFEAETDEEAIEVLDDYPMRIDGEQVVSYALCVVDESNPKYSDYYLSTQRCWPYSQDEIRDMLRDIFRVGDEDEYEDEDED